MRKSLLTLLLLQLIVVAVFAQAPQKVNYQAIVRDGAGQPLPGGTNVTVRFVIHDGTPQGAVVFQETNNAVTNQFGLITQYLGGTGNLAGVNWGNGAKYLQVLIDVAGGSNFTDMGTSQLLSVPYALYAANAGGGTTGATGATGADGQNGLDGATGATGADGQNGLDGATGATGADGQNGLDGATGATGADGQNGLDGATGATGADGQNGLDGATGATGADGQNGLDGATGATGADGQNGLDGATGATGADGQNGLNGDTGATGATGADGQNGLDGATGATGADGQNGLDGATGATGADGQNGLDGATGATGADGQNGLDGATGATGADGQNGLDGATGATGADGQNGLDGATGATGATGADGQNGLDGATGATGATGADGQNGLNGATGATGATGADGQNGLDGATGDKGDTGAQGDTGATGSTGATGATGADGQNGLDGATGATGADGQNGLNGATGATGDTGAQGATGNTGATGATGLLANGTDAGNTPYWDGAQWVVNSSNIYNNGGDVGIGTVNPSQKLEVSGDGFFNMILSQKDSFGLSGMIFSSDSSTDAAAIWRDNGGSFIPYGTLALQSTMAGPRADIAIAPEGFVGIGTVTPTSTLDVNGTFRYTDGNEDAGYVLTSDIDGNASWQPAGGGGFWTANGNDIYNNNGNNVGIGTAVPDDKLYVLSPISNRVSIEVQDDGFSGFRSKNSIAEYFAGINTGSSRYVLYDNYGGGERFTLTQGGNIGINQINPEATLDVNGTLRYTNGTEANGYVLTTDSAGNATWQPVGAGSGYWTANGNDIYNNNTSSVGIGTSNPVTKLTIEAAGPVDGFETMNALDPTAFVGTYYKVNGNVKGWAGYVGNNLGFCEPDAMQIGSWDNADIKFLANSCNSSMTIKASSGNVGVGNNSPAFPMHIGNDGQYQQDAKIGFSTSEGTGNYRTWSVGTQYGGIDAAAPNYGFYIRDETDGINRLVIDWSTGYVGIGDTNPQFKLDIQEPSSPRMRVKGNDGSFAGYLSENSTRQFFAGVQGDYESANGVVSGYHIYDNTAGAMRMVIEADGDMGIGTSAPTAKLDVDGQVRIRGGNPGAGKVLTSDADGLATWEIPTTLPVNPNAGDMVYYNGANWALVPVGQAGQFLQLSQSLVPTWVDVATAVPSVTSPQTGRVWMDRNLGATRIATSKTDALALGNLFQWGRGADGHEDPNSAITSTRSAGDNPGNGDFIIDPNTPNDWRLTTNNNLWQTATGNNNPCPTGYRIPTNAEWEAEFVGFAADADGAYNSFLKLPEGQDRNSYAGNVTTPGVTWYWSSTLSGNSPHFTSFNFNPPFGGSWQMDQTQFRAQGWPVRCILN